jgi:hypothetical protein
VHFKQACERDCCNIPATMDLLKVLLRSPSENEAEIETIFSTALNPIGDTRLSPKNESEMKILQGFHQFMLGGGNNETQAIQTWREAFEMNVRNGNYDLQNLFKVR